ncbi:MAG: histidine kinase, partial [Phycisphaerae bacterium]|nr:histidine kinase [Phycisphaerae bacterium]
MLDPSGDPRPHRLQRLMPFRVREILLVASRYDAYILEEEGKVTDLILQEFDRLNLRYAPRLNPTTRATEALTLLDSDRRFDMVIVTLHPREMDPADFAREVRRRHPRLPVVLLGYDDRELQELRESDDASAFDRIFIWTGDARILLALVSLIEDERNVEHDTAIAGVEVILFVEDSIHFISSFLPILYGKLLEQSQRLISEGLTVADSVLRMRARPKVLLATTYDEAWTLFQQHRQNILGVISDVSFYHDGSDDHDTAGAELARRMRRDDPDLPILLQSSDPANHRLARALDVGFLDKQSPYLTSQLEQFMRSAFGFGPFIFRRPDGTEVGQADSLAELRDRLETVPAESIKYHSDRNHFSAWLKARAEFRLADRLRPRRVDHFPDLEAMRRRVLADLDDYRRDAHRDAIAEFRPDTFGTLSTFARIGGGSLGGKARGLAFLNTLLRSYDHPSVPVAVPPTVVIGTQHFDSFIEQNDLADFASSAEPDEEVRRVFLAASLPSTLAETLLKLASQMTFPCAVRSSSLLEDSQYEPFAGVYETYMLPNQSPDPALRAAEFERAIKLVYASTFSERARTSLAATPHRPEKEKMAVIIQQLIGRAHGDIFYPSLSGVAQSYNYYPYGHVRPSDGAARVAVGLGKYVVEGTGGVRFSPHAPKHLPQGSTVDDILDNAQQFFDALPLDPGDADPHRQLQPHRYPIERTLEEPALMLVRSVYSRDDHTVTDGEGRPGTRLVTFAGVLKHNLFPLAELLRDLLDLGSTAMSTPVEIEFAV